MKKEFIVIRIDASPDGGPYVLMTIKDPRDVSNSNKPRAGPNTQVMGFNSMDDLMKNMQNTLSSLTKPGGGDISTTIKMEIREYEDSGIKVGDKISLEINKIEQSGV